MFANLLHYYTQLIQQLSGGDPIARGLISVWLLGTVTYLCRSIPKGLWVELKHQTTATGTFIDDGDYKNSMQMAFVENWLIHNSVFKLRNKNFHVTEDGDEVQRFSFGQYYVVIGFRIYLVHKYRDPGSSQKLVQCLNITTFGRDTKFIDNIVNEGKQFTNSRYYVISTHNDWRKWERKAIIQDSKTIFLDEETKRIIDEKVIFFRDNRDWFTRTNTPYKLTIVLYGEPGTGKSTIIRYISDLLQSDLYSLNLHHAYSSMESYLRRPARGTPTLIAIEDFENHAKKRSEIGDAPVEAETIIEGITGRDSGLDQLLNTLQGVYPLDNVAIVMTTNHIEKVDPALIRKGRTDLLLEIGRVGIKQVIGFFEQNYEQDFPDDIKEIKPIKACDMYGIFNDHPLDPQGYINELREKYVVVENNPKLTVAKG